MRWPSIFLSGGAAAAFQGRLAEDVGRQVRRVTLVSRLLVGAPSMTAVAQSWPGLLRALAQATRMPAAGRIVQG